MDFRKKPSKGLGRRKKSDRSDEQQWLFTYTASSGKRGESGLNEEDFETVEEVKMNDQGEVELDESDVIDGNLMKLWCRQAVEVN